MPRVGTGSFEFVALASGLPAIAGDRRQVAIALYAGPDIGESDLAIGFLDVPAGKLVRRLLVARARLASGKPRQGVLGQAEADQIAAAARQANAIFEAERYEALRDIVDSRDYATLHAQTGQRVRSNPAVGLALEMRTPEGPRVLEIINGSGWRTVVPLRTLTALERRCPPKGVVGGIFADAASGVIAVQVVQSTLADDCKLLPDQWFVRKIGSP